jgi:hypothetical protein
MGKAIAILGMHRSGTSAVSGLMGLLGANLGLADLLGYPAFDNAKGYFEFNPFVHVNETMMRRVDAAWDRLPSPMPDWANHELFQDLKPFVTNCVREHFGTSEVWAFKDPRCCFTFPFWRSVLPSPLKVVLVFRHPLEVADSLASRNVLPCDQSLALWSAYVTESIRGSSGLRRHVMFYEDLLESPKLEVKRLLDFTGLPDLPDGKWQEIESFMDRDLRHHRRKAKELGDCRELPAQVVKLFQGLRAHVDLARGGGAEDAALDLMVALEQPVVQREKGLNPDANVVETNA